MKKLLIIPALMLALSPAFAEAPMAEEGKAATVTLSATDEKASVVAESITKQAGVRILMEKSADVKVSVNVKDLSVEEALTAICKGGDLVWRKIHLRADSPALKNPDTLAATVRLVKGFNFPDLMVEASLEQESMVHIRQKPAVDSIPDRVRRDMGMVSLYLISNDTAAKASEEKANSNLAKYNELQKEAMELFMKMTPEEREQAMASGVQLMQQLSPGYMAEVTKSMMKNPSMMAEMTQFGMDAMFSMPAEDRRALMRMQMQAQQYITPEHRQMLMEDAKAVMEEMGLTPPQ